MSVFDYDLAVVALLRLAVVGQRLQAFIGPGGEEIQRSGRRESPLMSIGEVLPGDFQEEKKPKSSEERTVCVVQIYQSDLKFHPRFTSMRLMRFSIAFLKTCVFMFNRCGFK